MYGLDKIVVLSSRHRKRRALETQSLDKITEPFECLKANMPRTEVKIGERGGA